MHKHIKRFVQKELYWSTVLEMTANIHQERTGETAHSRAVQQQHCADFTRTRQKMLTGKDSYERISNKRAKSRPVRIV